ncbi:unnamed protein product, partial [Mesorhabditis spiculigera]
MNSLMALVGLNEDGMEMQNEDVKPKIDPLVKKPTVAVNNTMQAVANKTRLIKISRPPLSRDVKPQETTRATLNRLKRPAHDFRNSTDSGRAAKTVRLGVPNQPNQAKSLAPLASMKTGTILGNTRMPRATSYHPPDMTRREANPLPVGEDELSADYAMRLLDIVQDDIEQTESAIDRFSSLLRRQMEKPYPNAPKYPVQSALFRRHDNHHVAGPSQMNPMKAGKVHCYFCSTDIPAANYQLHKQTCEPQPSRSRFRYKACPKCELSFGWPTDWAHHTKRCGAQPPARAQTTLKNVLPDPEAQFKAAPMIVGMGTRTAPPLMPTAAPTPITYHDLPEPGEAGMMYCTAEGCTGTLEPKLMKLKDQFFRRWGCTTCPYRYSLVKPTETSLVAAVDAFRKQKNADAASFRSQLKATRAKVVGQTVSSLRRSKDKSTSDDEPPTLKSYPSSSTPAQKEQPKSEPPAKQPKKEEKEEADDYDSEEEELRDVERQLQRIQRESSRSTASRISPTPSQMLHRRKLRLLANSVLSRPSDFNFTNTQANLHTSSTEKASPASQLGALFHPCLTIFLPNV